MSEIQDFGIRSFPKCVYLACEYWDVLRANRHLHLFLSNTLPFDINGIAVWVAPCIYTDELEVYFSTGSNETDDFKSFGHKKFDGDIVDDLVTYIREQTVCASSPD